jgi:probable addiction module antidote protein
MAFLQDGRLLRNVGPKARIEDPALFLLALRQGVRAKGMAGVARQSGLQRESLYKSLSAIGNPDRINSVISLCMP